MVSDKDVCFPSPFSLFSKIIMRNLEEYAGIRVRDTLMTLY